jgi:hypothetical protein
MTETKKPRKKTPTGTMVHKDIEFPLTEKEFSTKGKEAAKLSKEVNSLEDQFDEKKKEWSTKIKDREVKRDEILSVIHAGKEIRRVEVMMEKDYNAKEIRYHFEGKVVEIRAMTKDELQMEIDFQKNVQRAKALKNKIQGKHKDGEGVPAVDKTSDIGSVIAEETNRRTKLSAVDGPNKNTANSVA